jgi:integrase
MIPHNLQIRLCTPFYGYRLSERRKSTYKQVFPRFSFHRLRHYMTTTLANNNVDAATLMALGGWSSFETMQQYAKVFPETLERSYCQAMERAREAQAAGTTKIMSIEEYFSQAGA